MPILLNVLPFVLAPLCAPPLAVVKSGERLQFKKMVLRIMGQSTELKR